MLKVGLKNKKGIKIDLPGTLKMAGRLFDFIYLCIVGNIWMRRRSCSVATRRNSCHCRPYSDKSLFCTGHVHPANCKIEFHYRTTLKYSPVH